MKTRIVLKNVAVSFSVALLLGVYLVTVYSGCIGSNSDGRDDIMEFFSYGMLILCFPIGGLVSMILGIIFALFYWTSRVYLDALLGTNITGSPHWVVEVTVTWGLFVFAWYLQWFIFTPWIVRVIQRLSRRWSIFGFGMNNDLKVELHDAELSGLEWQASTLRLKFSYICVYNRTGDQTVDINQTFESGALISVDEAVLVPTTVCPPITVADGTLRVGKSFFENLLPLALPETEDFELMIVGNSVDGALVEFRVTGASGRIVLLPHP